MATPRKRTAKVKTVADESYSKLDQYAIEMHEFYKSLRKAGFTNDNALWLLASKDSHPDWLETILKKRKTNAKRWIPST
jgi:hypothetical protein